MPSYGDTFQDLVCAIIDAFLLDLSIDVIVSELFAMRKEEKAQGGGDGHSESDDSESDDSDNGSAESDDDGRDTDNLQHLVKTLEADAGWLGWLRPGLVEYVKCVAMHSTHIKVLAGGGGDGKAKSGDGKAKSGDGKAKSGDGKAKSGDGKAKNDVPLWKRGLGTTIDAARTGAKQAVSMLQATVPGATLVFPTDATVKLQVTREVKSGVKRAKRQLQFMIILYASYCEITYNDDVLEVTEPQGVASSLFMQGMQFITRRRHGPSFWWDARRRLTDMLRRGIGTYHSKSGKVPAVFSVAKFMQTAATRTAERFVVWFSGTGQGTLLPLLDSVAPGLFKSNERGQKKASQRLKEQTLRKQCLGPMAPHMVSRAQIFYFQRMEGRVMERLQRAIGLKRTDQTLTNILGIVVSGDNVELQITDVPVPDSMRPSLAMMLSVTLHESFTSADANYLHSSTTLAENIANAIIAIAEPEKDASPAEPTDKDE
jgi:hypothetical protein